MVHLFCAHKECLHQHAAVLLFPRQCLPLSSDTQANWESTSRCPRTLYSFNQNQTLWDILSKVLLSYRCQPKEPLFFTLIGVDQFTAWGTKFILTQSTLRIVGYIVPWAKFIPLWLSLNTGIEVSVRKNTIFNPESLYCQQRTLCFRERCESFIMENIYGKLNFQLNFALEHLRSSYGVQWPFSGSAHVFKVLHFSYVPVWWKRIHWHCTPHSWDLGGDIWLFMLNSL